MRVYEAAIKYKLLSNGKTESLCTAEKVVEYMAGAFDDAPVAEMFYVICLSRKNKPICRVRITVGTVDATLAHPREVFRAAILASASAIICCHNHPSGDPSPSPPDLHLTRRLRESSRTLDIDLLDHVIIGDVNDDPAGNGYFSFRNAGLSCRKPPKPFRFALPEPTRFAG